MMPAVFRTVAWLIVIAGIIDPVVAMNRMVKPEVALAADARLPDAALVDRVERALRGGFTIVRGPSPRTAAVVTVGYQMPSVDVQAAGHAFAVVPAPQSPFVAITAVAAGQPLLRSRLPIDITMRSIAARGKTVAVTLRSDGIAIDRLTKEIGADDVTDRVQLQFTPSATGAVSLTVEAQIGDGAPATVSLNRTVRDGRVTVLFFDRRPSWMSTFVRRAVEADPRFIVTSRVATSKSGPSITAGQPPATLSMLPSLELFDTLVVGAAEEITDQDAAGLSAWMRDRGGSVVLLLDEQEPSKHSAALRRLTGVNSWTLTERGEPFGSPRASAVLAPTSLPEWAEPVPVEGNKDADLLPAVWRTAVGRGTLVVSGALDSWRYRDSSGDEFGLYWRRLVAEGGPEEAEAERATGVEPDERALLAGWTESRGGRVVSESTLSELPQALTAALKPTSERRPTRPMQWPWWIAPFALALGGEWWMRRRSGQR